ncbi:MAG: glycosyltransferase family 2 protein [Thiotrichales bacterium]
MGSKPKITVHIPVYNGDNYLETEIDSLLAQTCTDFELLITDNCSTDRTAEICQHYARQDPRVRYVRNKRDIGSNPNFDLGVELARGEYFKWASHDDFHAPEFLERCVEVLDNDPDVVLVHSLVQIVDKNGDNLTLYDSRLRGSDSDDPVERFKPLTHIRHVCTDIFGVFRTDALRSTRLNAANYHAVDRALLAEISLIGKIVQIKEPLFFNREHDKRYVRRVRPSERSSYHQHSANIKTEIDQLLLYRDYQAAVERHLTTKSQKRRARFVLLTWWLVEWNTPRLVVELFSWKLPFVYDWAKWVSDRIVKPQHPTIITKNHSK